MPRGVGRVLISLVPPSAQSLMHAQHLPICSFSLCSFFAKETAQEAAPSWVWKVAQRAFSKITLMLEAAEA